LLGPLVGTFVGLVVGSSVGIILSHLGDVVADYGTTISIVVANSIKSKTIIASRLGRGTRRRLVRRAGRRFLAGTRRRCI
jgi:hypothetical protein